MRTTLRGASQPSRCELLQGRPAQTEVDRNARGTSSGRGRRPCGLVCALRAFALSLWGSGFDPRLRCASRAASQRKGPVACTDHLDRPPNTFCKDPRTRLSAPTQRRVRPRHSVANAIPEADMVPAEPVPNWVGAPPPRADRADASARPPSFGTGSAGAMSASGECLRHNPSRILSTVHTHGTPSSLLTSQPSSLLTQEHELSLHGLYERIARNVRRRCDPNRGCSNEVVSSRARDLRWNSAALSTALLSGAVQNCVRTRIQLQCHHPSPSWHPATPLATSGKLAPPASPSRIAG